MKNWLQRMNAALARSMYGRNGFDEFSKALFIASIILYLFSGFFLGQILYPISLVLIIYALFRGYSKNLDKRRSELNWYIRKKEKIAGPLRMRKQKHTDRKTHKYIKCRSCGTYLRVPKGVGKIVVTCPKCKNKGEMKV